MSVRPFRAVPPIAATFVVQVAALALALGTPTVGQACVVGMAALLFLLANDGHTVTPARSGVLAGAALTTLAAVVASLVPGDVGSFGWCVPLALVALYVLATLSPFSLPRRQNRGTARGPRRSS
jgi:peptidoglycan/LPS O-acetylase OafA/YrhL